MSEPKLQGKSYDIPKTLVWDAWLKVKKKGGAAALAFGYGAEVLWPGGSVLADSGALASIVT